MLSFFGIACFLGGVITAPIELMKTNIPPNGFPNPSQSQLQRIQQAALGTLSNASLPSQISSDGITSLQFINFNENFEVQFFTSLLNNVTNNVPGYTFQNQTERDVVVKILNVVIAQEELHAITAASALKSQGKDAIQPCQYQFPTSNFVEAITLAYTFTDVALGALGDVIVHFAQSNDVKLTGLIASVIGQEGEQNGYFRYVLGKVPSALPFLTPSIRDFAFTALQGYNLPGSCPNIGDIKLTTFAPLQLYNKNIQPSDQILKFAFDTSTLAKSTVPNATSYISYDWNKAGLVYVNQQNVPVVVQLQNITTSGTYIAFQASFPYSEHELNGLTAAAVTKNQGPFADGQSVANAAVFGPAAIEVN